MNVYLKKYIPIVDFLAEVLGNDAEVVLHDLSDISNSVVAIRNKHVSGRDIGSPATNLVLKIMKDGKYKNKNYIANYNGASVTGKTLKSSSYFIRDDQHQIIGMLCINIDNEKLVQLRNYLDSILQPRQESEEDKTIERFSHSVEELSADSIQTVIDKVGAPPERMSQDEKIKIVKKLNENGVFLLRGSVSKIAAMLKVSEPTIYRYLNNIKKEG